MLKKQEADILFDGIGGFGRYQRFQFFILSLLSIVSIDVLYFNFISYVPDHWCKSDLGEVVQNRTTDRIKNLTIPWDYKRDQFSQCSRYSYPKSFTDNHHGNNTKNESEIVKCEDWEFDDSIFQDTIVTRWKLVCDRRWMVDILPTAQSFGILFGSFVAGMMADKYGRLLTLVIFTLLKLGSSVVSMVAPLFSVLAIARFVMGFCSPGTYTVGFILGSGNWTIVINQQRYPTEQNQVSSHPQNVVMPKVPDLQVHDPVTIFSESLIICFRSKV